ncbi:MAG TPA: hypothetical protein DCW46_09820 [Desulfotomaculum sp.]|nr:hypothetical protein [Desulfotomaculum sp.]
MQKFKIKYYRGAPALGRQGVIGNQVKIPCFSYLIWDGWSFYFAECALDYESLIMDRFYFPVES